MAQYVATQTSTLNSTPNTLDTIIEISVGVITIKKIAVRVGDGTETSGVDNNVLLKLYRKTAGGATGTGGTAVRMDQRGGTSAATVTVKNGTNAFTTATLGDLLDICVINGRERWVTLAIDEDDKIKTHATLGSGGMFAIVAQSPVASQKITTSVWWTE